MQSLAYKRELLAVSTIIIIVLLISLIPFAYAFLSTPEGLVFIGSRYNNFLDFPTYISWIDQGRQGNFFLYDLFTLEFQGAVYFHPLFWIVGIVGSLTTLPNVFLYYLAKFIIGFIYLLIGYHLIRIIVIGVPKRLYLFSLFAIGSGLGWIYGFPSVDIIQSEATNFLTLYESLINTTAIALILGIFYLFLQIDYQRSIYFKLLGIGVLGNLLILIHTYDIVFVLLVIFAYSIFKYFKDKNYKHLRSVYIIFFSVSPSILWVTYVLNNNSALNIWAHFQTSVPAQGIIGYLATFGPLLVLAVIGFALYFRKENTVVFLGLWLSIGLVLLFNPFSDRFQQKLSPGLFIPLIILAGLGLIHLTKKLVDHQHRFLKYTFSFMTVLFLSMTNINVMADDMEIFSKHESPLYESANTIRGIEWLKSNTLKSETLLSSYRMGNLIPAIAGRKVYVGHYDQTVNFDMKMSIMQAMMISEAGDKDPLRHFLSEEGVSYIFVDEEVRSWGGLSIDNRPYLQLVYDNIDVQIYKIEKTLLN